MIPSRLTIGLLLIAGASLSSCSGKEEGDAFASSNLSAAIDRSDAPFGKGFEKKFRADPNSDPTEVKNDDLAPVSFTTEPVPID